MSSRVRVAAVTGASGYLGSRICTTLESRGWNVFRLVRSLGASPSPTVAYDLAAPVSTEVEGILRSADVLVHTAYDLSLTRRDDIWRVNVEGSRRLLEAAVDTQIRRILTLSSMSAYVGTEQLYGQAKLEIEEMTLRAGGVALRPGLVYGECPGGMAAALRKLTKLPVVPVITGGARQYTTWETDLTDVILAMATTESLIPQTVSVAHPVPVPLSDLLRAFAAEEHRRCRFVSVPWRPLYAAMKAADALRLRLPFRADSLLGLVRIAPSAGGSSTLHSLGLDLHAFAPVIPARS